MDDLERFEDNNSTILSESDVNKEFKACNRMEEKMIIGPASMIKERFKITKSETDDRLYRGLTLQNGMRVLLISDPTTEKSAAALDAYVGYASDLNSDGLAHLCEHAIYFSSKINNPQYNFMKYVTDNSGTMDAKTLENHTTFYFDIEPSAFTEALTRFAMLFVKKNLSLNNKKDLEYLINCHLYNEELELSDNEKYDLMKLIKSNIERGHSIAKCSLGNFTYSTYSDNFYDVALRKVSKFYDVQYSADMMTLCVLGKESLDELEISILNLFYKIEEKDNYYRPSWPAPSCDSVHKIWSCNYTSRTPKLCIIVPICELLSYFTMTPERFLAYLFKYKGKRTFASVVESRGWGTDIDAGELPCSVGYHFFGVAIELTEKGVQHADDIVGLFIQYVNLLKEKRKERRWLYNDYKKIAELKFRFKEKESPIKYVQFLSRNMQLNGFEYVLREGCVPFRWKPEFFDRMIKTFLTPLKMRIFLSWRYINKYTNHKKLITNARIPTYLHPSPCVSEIVPVETCAKWQNARIELDLPASNEFIPTTITVKPHKDKVSKVPIIIKDTRFVKLWYKRDDEFNEPRATTIFHFIYASTTYTSSHVNVHFNLMFVRLVNDSLRDYVYPATLVDLKWEISATIYGILIKINGFNDKQNVLLEKIVDRIVNFKLTRENFEVVRHNNQKISTRQLKEFEKSQPYDQARHYLRHIVTDNLWTTDQILKAHTHVTFEKLEKFITNLFCAVHMECLIHGNVTKAEAISMAELVEKKLRANCASPLAERHLAIYRDVKLENGTHFIFQRDNTKHLYSCTQVFYQIDKRSIMSDVLLELVQQIIKRPFYKTFLDERRVGSYGYTNVHRGNSMQGLTILVHGPKHLHPIICEKIDKFLRSMSRHIRHMSEKIFYRHTAALAESRRKKPQTMNDLSNRFWTEIASQHYNFNRVDMELNYLKTAKLSDLQHFYEELICEKSAKLSLHITSVYNLKMKAHKYIPHDNVRMITDIKEFRNSQILYPLPAY